MVQVWWAPTLIAQTSDQNQLFVGDLSSSVSDEMLYKAFSKFGTLT